MSWKKNAFSYVCWFLYAVLTGTALLCLAGYTADVMRLEIYWTFIFGLLFCLCAAVVVILLHRISIEVSAYMGGRRVLEGLSKSILLAVLATIGLYLRMRLIDGLGTISNELARTILFALAIQMAAAFLLFFILNKLSGYFCGLISFGFIICSPGIVQCLDDGSIEMLSLLILLIVFGLMVPGYRKKLYPVLYFFYGALAAFVARLDFVGILLLCMILAIVFVNREQGASAMRKLAAILCSVFGFVAGLCGTLAVESLLGQKAFDKLFLAWVFQYRPENFQVPVSVEVGDFFAEVCVLVGLMVFGIFSFWYDRNREQLAFGTLLLYGLIALTCFGMDGEFFYGSFLIYLLMVVLAGVSVQQCINGLCVAREILLPEEPVTENLTTGELVLEELETEPPVVGEPVTEGLVAENLVTEELGTEGMETEPPVTEELGTENTVTEEPVKEELREAIEEFMQQETPLEIRNIQFIENPLPLPKKHEKRVLDFDVQITAETSGYDVQVADDDDFDI